MKTTNQLRTWVGGIFLLAFTIPAFGQKENKELKTTCIQASMTCNGCKTTIEKNISFEKGVKSVVADLSTHTVRITYLDGKNTPEKLADAIQKLGYDVAILDEKECPQPNQ